MVIKEQTWQKVNIRTWGDLSTHQWLNFRLAMMEFDSEMKAHGVAVDQSGATNEFDFGMKAQGVVIEHSSVIFEFRPEMIVNTIVSERDYLSEMLKFLPLYERKSVIFQELLQAYDSEFRRTEQEIQITDRNLFIDTAIEFLSLYERDLGIESFSNLRYDQRREQIHSRYRAAFDQTTEDTIKLVASAFSNGEVEVNKTDTPGLYEVKFVGTMGIPDNMNGLKKALDIIIPAHLGFSYNYVFNTWEFVSGRTWGDVSSMTWDELRTWDEED